MAQQDYVKRGRKASTRKNTKNMRTTKRKNTKRRQKSGGFPLWRMTIAACFVLTFVVGLYFLNFQDTPSKNEKTVTNDVETDVKKSFKKVDELPVLQEEEWAFIDSLPDYEVEVSVESQTSSEQDYIMQCGSFKTYEKADSLRVQIVLQGFESQIIESDGSNGRWFRVVLGPYQSKRDAEKQRHALRRSNINGCKIW